MRRDDRSPEAAEYRRRYHTARWRRIRKRQLAAAPLCRLCAERGVSKLANTVDHVEPHRGDPDKFWNGPFQSLCGPCHARHGQIKDRGGATPLFGADGWPVP